MKFRNTLAIAVLFLALGAYLYFVESEKIREESKKTTLLSVTTDEVTGVTLTYPESEIVLKKTGSGWRIQKPIDVEADESTVTNLVRAVAEAELKRTLDGPPGSLETYGLDKPAAIVTLALADGKTLPAIRVGKTTPVGYSTYVQLDGSSEIKLVPSAFSSGMKKEVKDLRNKVIVDFKDDDVQRIEVSGGDSSLALARDGSEWKIEKPEALQADASEVRGFLSSLRSLRAQEFFDQAPSLADFGLEAPRRRIAVLLGKDLARKEILVGAEKERNSKKELYVKRGEGDTVFAVGSWAWTSLDKGVSAFRDKTVLAFDRSALAAVEVARSDGEPFRLVRRDTPPATAAATPPPTPAKEIWTLEGAPASKETQITQLVSDLHALKGYEVAAESPSDLGAFGLTSPALTFSLIDRDGKPIGRILLAATGGTGSSEKREAYAMAEGSNLVYRVRDYTYSHLDKKRADLVEPEPSASATPAVTPATSAEGDEEPGGAELD